MVTYAAYPHPMNFPIPDGAAGTRPFAQTFDRRLVNNIIFQPTTATLYLSAIWLPGDLSVNGITFVSGATAESGGSNLWYALYNRTPAGVVSLMAQATSNAGAAAFAANTAFRMALTSAQRLTYSGWYYLGFCCVGTTPALYNITTTGINTNGNIAGLTPIVAASADAALTNTAPPTAGALTTIVQALYAYVD